MATPEEQLDELEAAATLPQDVADKLLPRGARARLGSAGFVLSDGAYGELRARAPWEDVSKSAEDQLAVLGRIREDGFLALCATWALRDSHALFVLRASSLFGGRWRSG